MNDMPADQNQNVPVQDQNVPVQNQQVSPQQDDAVSLSQAALQSLGSYDPLNPPYAGKSGTKKETTQGSSDVTVTEVPGVQVIEHEPSVEIAPEVQGWIEKIEQEKLNIPEHIVVADDTAAQPTGNYASSPVIVLPMTEDQVKKGLNQNVKQSVRWLATWCVRVIKMFKGSVVYRQEEIR